ncbi:MAG: flagellar assembly protein FliH [Hydrogenophaga sp.]|uniref:Flagellar assembly protein FliH n=1 Tax=Hydrogenophaga crocea TaxID=2716225 RepID=A0A6G8IMC6_9BURK|nr:MULTISPECIES: flagellar assembly protein FliH [Hydrogenophaga]MBL0943289.1 flagellar assembly protein FliH [Hydrogenophaga sp.]QIM54321.1 flagellar assembly protein FliH [Hydrogenophaga crocea]
MTKIDPYARFIPREEIDGVAAWQFSAVDGSDQRAPAPAETPDPAADERMAEVREQAYAEGFRHGHDAGAQSVRDAMEATMRRTAEETAVRMAQLLRHTRDHIKRSEQDMSRHILDLACDLARQVVRQELVQNPQHLQGVVAEALNQLIDDGLPATVRMHPSDLALMKGALIETLGEPAPEFVGDPAITPGGCVVESRTNSVDATVEKRWLRAIGNLGLSEPYNPADADI